jgi:hypothetical protein
VPNMTTVTNQDDNYYYMGDKKIAKNGLSANKRAQFDAMLPAFTPSTPVVAQQSMAPKPGMAYDPRFDAPDAQIEQINSLDQLGINPNAVSSAAMAPAMNVANPAPVQNPALPPMQPLQPMIARQSVQTDTQAGITVDPKIIKAQEENYKQRIESAKQIGIAEQQAAQEQLKEMQKTEFEIAQQDYMRSQIEERKQIAVGEAMGKYEATIKELDDAKVDPDRFYGGSMGKRVLAAISIGLGEFSRIWTGGNTNNAMNIINKAIDDDIGAQRANITQLGNKANLQRQMMSDLKAKYDDEQQGNLAVRAAMLDQAQRKVTQIGLGLKSEQAKANAMDMAARLDQEKQNSLLQLAQLTSDKTQTRVMTEYAQPQGTNTKETNQAATDLRKEYNSHPVTKTTYARKEHLNNIEAAAAGDSGISDIAVITSYVKMLDPTSTVNAGETATARNTAGIDDRMRNLYNRIANGGTLSDTQKKQFVAVTRSIWNKQLKEQARIDKQFSALGAKQGVDINDIIAPMDTTEQKPENLSSTFVPKSRGK